MEDTDFKTLWKAQDEKLDKTMKLNLFLLESLQKQKAESKLNSLARYKTGVTILGIAWILFLGLLVYGNQFKNLFFSVSVLMIALCNLVAVIIYIKHIVLIKQLDYSNSITHTQKKLTQLQTSTFSIGRILWLQLPFYSSFFWSWEMIGDNDIRFWLIAVPITLVFTFVAIWLYKNLTPKNVHKKLVKTLVLSSIEYTAVIRAREFLHEIEEFKM
jgi:hypothetical protein